ncbi:hypothetical protein B0H13DRAFT_2300830 [Mycena leptocephala]|nr:hypothetical protein B0H13DRAFT_2300830 [Mycena leptocephala]
MIPRRHDDEPLICRGMTSHDLHLRRNRPDGPVDLSRGITDPHSRETARHHVVEFLGGEIITKASTTWFLSPYQPPSSALPTSTSLSQTFNGNPIPLLQRAQNLSYIPGSPITSSPAPILSLSSLLSRRTTKSIGKESASVGSPLAKEVAEPSGKEKFDVDKASPDQLRQTLKVRNQEFDELASYLLKLTEAHVADKQALLKKVASLEHEAWHLKNEVKGLTWLVTNGTWLGSGGNVGKPSDMASKSTSAPELTDPSDEKLSSFGPSNPAEDSGLNRI